jgi:hypothetical protein
MGNDRINRQRFWQLLERKLLGIASIGELSELDEIANVSKEAFETIVLVEILWPLNSIDEMEEVIRKNFIHSNENKFLRRKI